MIRGDPPADDLSTFEGCISDATVEGATTGFCFAACSLSEANEFCLKRAKFLDPADSPERSAGAIEVGAEAGSNAAALFWTSGDIFRVGEELRRGISNGGLF